MKIIGLMCVKNEDDILEETLNHAGSFLDGIVALDNGSTDRTQSILMRHPAVLRWSYYPGTFDESKMVPKLLKIAGEFQADWYVDHDADEFFDPSLRERLISIPLKFNVATVNILSAIDGHGVYDVKTDWQRCYRNEPSNFDFADIKQLHHGKIPFKKSERFKSRTGVNVIHKPVRSFKQGMRKYENYKSIDTGGIQGSYEHIRALAEGFNNNFKGIPFIGPINSKTSQPALSTKVQ
jgi:glycosyltransferase involved in cell wall biosynthesis